MDQAQRQMELDGLRAAITELGELDLRLLDAQEAGDGGLVRRLLKRVAQVQEHRNRHLARLDGVTSFAAPSSIPCPHCGMPSGKACRTPSGLVSRTHAARWKAAGLDHPSLTEFCMASDQDRQLDGAEVGRSIKQEKDPA